MEPNVLGAVLEGAGSNGNGVDHECLHVLRQRYDQYFRTPFVVECREEITFYNNTQTDIQVISYPLAENRKKLHIFDSNGDLLEFYRDFLGDGDKQGVFIAFFRGRHLAPQEIRTIRIEYEWVIEEYQGDYFFYTFNLGHSRGTYVSFEYPSSFYFDIHLFIRGHDNATNTDEFFLLMDLEEFHDYVSVKRYEHSLDFHSTTRVENCELMVFFKHKLTYSQMGWYTLGAFLGGFAVVALSCVLYAYPNLSLPIVLPVATLVNGYLLVTKGWLFEPDMEKITGAIKITDKLEFTIDSLYIMIIVLLIVIIGLAIYFGCSPNDGLVQTYYQFIRNEIVILS